MLRILLSAAVLAAVIAATTLTSSAAGADEDCQVVVGGPFVYHTTVIPESYVDCATTKGRIRDESQLSRDGVVVRTARRDCRNTTRCYLDIDVSAEDVPGNQVWCVTTWGSVKNHAIAPATACESAEF